MEALLLIGLIIIFFVVLSVKSSVNEKLTDLQLKFKSFEEEINRLTALLQSAERDQRKREAMPPPERTESRAAAPIIIPEVKPPQPPQQEKTEEKKEEIKRTVDEPQRVIIPEPVKPVDAPRIVIEEPIFERPIQSQPKEKTPDFFERNPDLEKFIGENLANKIGIAILVIGIGFFVKYAIDQNWINEIGRVAIGVLCGGILLGVAHRLRKTFSAFSSVLVGGGIAVLYFTIAIAFHEYQIFSQVAAFVLMVVITGFTIVLSLGYNRVELAVLAILGGFGSPFMVSTGEGNYIVLFTYLLILNGGMLVLAYHKKWKIINIICYVFTILIFGGWIGSRFDHENVSMIRGALLFATLFYFIFFLMNIINNLRQRTMFQALEIMTLLSNTFLYYSAGMIILSSDVAKDFQGLFTALLGVFNFLFAYFLYKNAKADRNLVFMLIGLVLTFISLAAPIQLEGNYITLFWAAEAVLLLWLSQKSGIKLISYASVAVMFLMVISLLMDWKQIYVDGYDVQLMIILNKGYITSIAGLISLVLTLVLLRQEKEESLINRPEYKLGLTLATGLFLYIANFLELRHQVNFYVEPAATRDLIIGLYNMCFIFGLFAVEEKLRIPDQLKKAFPLWGIVAMLAYLFYYHEVSIAARDNYLEGTSSFTGFIFHYAVLIVLLVNMLISLKKINDSKELVESIKASHWWVYITIFVFLASAELDHIVVLLANDPQQTFYFVEHNHRIGFPILWGITSFLLIAAGLKRKIKMLRIISLVLMLFTLLKLFIVDLRDISEGGKIAAFISLGVLLLIVSFMYQRLKKLLLEDTVTEPEQKS